MSGSMQREKMEPPYVGCYEVMVNGPDLLGGPISNQE
jgi:hypothetical protein